MWCHLPRMAVRSRGHRVPRQDCGHRGPQRRGQGGQPVGLAGRRGDGSPAMLITTSCQGLTWFRRTFFFNGIASLLMLLLTIIPGARPSSGGLLGEVPWCMACARRRARRAASRPGRSWCWAVCGRRSTCWWARLCCTRMGRGRRSGSPCCGGGGDIVGVGVDTVSQARYNVMSGRGDPTMPAPRAPDGTPRPTGVVGWVAGRCDA
mmetsp:Transcript_78759/g.218869  ORF Transcript_78759/g.218869 Transcript_78759/m.218869 type:complete len:206 (+) Transcript_78759:719-1336(+)